MADASDVHLISDLRALFEDARQRRKPMVSRWLRNYSVVNSRPWSLGRASWKPAPDVPEIFPILSARVAFASKATGDYVVFDRAPGSYHSLSIAGTVDRERAVTRATVESIERWAAKNRWLTRSEWTIVDIAASQDV